MINLKKSLLAGSAVLAMGISTASLAAYGLPEAPAPVYNWYFGGFGGLTYTPSIRYTDRVAGETDIERFNNPNWDIGAHLGYRYDQLRFELEYLYQHSTDGRPYTAFEFGGTDLNSVTGRTSVHSAMGNVLYDINIDSSIVPYLGVGIGYTNINDTLVAQGQAANGTILTVIHNNPSPSRFGYQALAGFGFKVMENATFNFGYRYFGTSSGNSTRWQNHLFNVGFDYYFM